MSGPQVRMISSGSLIVARTQSDDWGSADWADAVDLWILL